MKRHRSGRNEKRRFRLAVFWVVFIIGLCLIPSRRGYAQDVRQTGAGFGIARRAANQAAEKAGRADWPTLGDGGTTGTQVHVSFNARNADVTLVTPANYPQTQLLADAQKVAWAANYPRADYILYDNIKTSVVDMELNNYLRPLPNGKSGADFVLSLTRLARALSVTKMPRPIVFYVSGEDADEATLTDGTEKSQPIGAAYFASADELTHAAGDQTVHYRAQIGWLSYVIAFGFAAMLLFAAVTVARMPWVAAEARRKAALKKADEAVPDPAEVQKRYNAQKPLWVIQLSVFSPLLLVPIVFFLARGHGLKQAAANAFLLFPSLASSSPAAFPVFLFGGAFVVGGTSWGILQLTERAKAKRARVTTNADSTAAETIGKTAEKAEDPMQGFFAPIIAMAASVPLMFLVTLLPRSARVALGPTGLKSLIFGIMGAGFLAGALISYRNWQKQRTTLFPGDPWHDMVREVAQKAGGVRVRRVVLTRAAAPNASASVLNTVSLTTGLVAKMEPDEVRVVIAHEVAHLKSGHTKKTLGISLLVFAVYMALYWFVLVPLKSRIGPVAFALMGSPLPGMLLGNLLVPLVVGRGQRKREHEADRLAAQIVGDPELVIHTLRKLHTLSASPHYLKPSDELLGTHPSLAHRIDALRQLSDPPI